MADRDSQRQQIPHDGAGRRSDAPSSFDTENHQRGRTGHSRSNQPPDPSPSGRQFLFIDASTDRTTSGEAVRVHVMREAHRTRRERQSSQNRGSGRRAAAQDEMVILESGPTSRPTPPAPSISNTKDQMPSNAQVVSSVDWQSILRTGIPPSSLESVAELEHLAEDLRRHRPFRPDMLHLCRGDFLSMDAYLALAMTRLALGQQESSNVASVQLETRALEQLRQRITEAVPMHTDTTLVAILLLSQLEQLKGNAEAANFHRHALQRLVHDRGGLASLQDRSPELRAVLLASGFAEAET